MGPDPRRRPPVPRGRSRFGGVARPARRQVPGVGQGLVPQTRGLFDGDADAKCFLYDHGGHDRDDTNLFLPRTTLGHSGYAASWSISVDTAAPVQVNLMCGSGDSGGRIKAQDIRISAVKVDHLSAA